MLLNSDSALSSAFPMKLLCERLSRADWLSVCFKLFWNQMLGDSVWTVMCVLEQVIYGVSSQLLQQGTATSHSSSTATSPALTAPTLWARLWSSPATPATPWSRAPLSSSAWIPATLNGMRLNPPAEVCVGMFAYAYVPGLGQIQKWRISSFSVYESEFESVR